MAAQKHYRGDTLGKIFYIKNENDQLFDPTTLTLTITDPNDATEDTLTLVDLTKTDTGTYKMNWNIPNDAAIGLWTITAVATYSVGSLKNTEKFVFNVVG